MTSSWRHVHVAHVSDLHLWWHQCSTQLGDLHRSESNSRADRERERNRRQDTRHDEHGSAAKSSALERAEVSVVADGAHRSGVCRHARCKAVAEDMDTSVEAEI